MNNKTEEDLKKEINQLEKAAFNTFIKEGKPPIYTPDQIYSFCKTANAGNLFNFILSSISSDRHSKDRKEIQLLSRLFCNSGLDFLLRIL